MKLIYGFGVNFVGLMDKQVFSALNCWELYELCLYKLITKLCSQFPTKLLKLKLSIPIGRALHIFLVGFCYPKAPFSSGSRRRNFED